MSVLAWIYWVSVAVAFALTIFGVYWDFRHPAGRDEQGLPLNSQGEHIQLTLLDLLQYAALCLCPLINTIFSLVLAAYVILDIAPRIVLFRGK